MASIYLRGRIWWVEFIDPTGKRNQSSLNTTDETLARHLCLEMTSQEKAQKNSAMTVERFGKKWISERYKLDIRDARNEEQRLRDHVFPVIGHLTLATLRPGNLRDWAIEVRSEKGLAPRTLHNIYGVIRSMIRSARVEGFIDIDPCILTQAELGKLRDKDIAWRATAVFGKEELLALVSSPLVPNDRQVINALAGLAGLRQGEVCALRWSDIERREPLSAIVVTRSHDKDTKTEVARPVPVHPMLASLLASWRLGGWYEMVGRKPLEGDLVVPSAKTKKGPAGRPRTMSMVYKGWLKDIKALELRHRRYHDLRRTFISLALADGARRDVLERITHQALASRAIDLYTTLPWGVLCAEVAKLDLSEVSRDSARPTSP